MQQDSKKTRRKNLIWTAVFVLIAAASIWAVISRNKNFSFARYLDYLRGSNPIWLCAAFACMLLFILLSAEAIRVLLRAFSEKRSPLQGLTYAAADLYFSAITPSATGGQPAAAWFMMKDGVSGAVTTVTLVANLAMYTVSIVLIAGACLLLRPSIFLRFSTISRVLIVIGAVIQVSLAALYCLLLWKEDLLRRFTDKILPFILRLKIIRKKEELQDKVNNYINKYSESAIMLRGKHQAMIKCLLLNLALRTAHLSVSVFCYLAQGGPHAHAFDLFALQSNVVMGVTFVPIPGAMGITDFLMLDGFQSIMTEQTASNLELLSRTTSFYFCILICGLIVFTRLIVGKFRKKRTTP